MSKETDAFDDLADALEQARAMPKPEAYTLLRLAAVSLEESPFRDWFMKEMAVVVGLDDALREAFVQ